jgi:hypothetical protein
LELHIFCYLIMELKHVFIHGIAMVN